MTSKDEIIKFIKKSKIKITITFILTIALIIASFNLLKSNSQASLTDTTNKAKEVKTQIINNKLETKIEAVGIVKADTKVAVKALTSGTVKTVLFKVGDKITKNSTLTNLSNDTVMTNSINAQTNLVNLKSNASITKQLTTEVLRQAELQVEGATKTVTSAEIALTTAKDNLKNSKTINKKEATDTKNNALISITADLNTVFNTLKQINTIIQADKDNSQVDGIKNTLAVLDLSSLNLALLDYRKTSTDYDIISTKQFNPNTISLGMNEMVLLLAQTKSAIDSTIEVLENTTTSANFTQTALATQRDKFIGLRSAIVVSQTSAEKTLQSLQNIGLSNTQQLDSLNNSVASAENQLASAELSYQNALAGFANAQISVERDLLSSQSSVDNANSQLNLINVQVADLRISAPISGTITNKLIEPGDEVNPGQTIAEISQTAKLIIEVDFPAEDIIKLNIGQVVYINPSKATITGTISQIYPTADPMNKKVRVEIIVANNSDLVPESFVNISIPLESNSANDNKTNNTFFIPLKAVTISPNENYVFIVVNDSAKKIIVSIGQTEGDKIEILSGLNINDQLIIDGNKSLSDNETIIVIN